MSLDRPEEEEKDKSLLGRLGSPRTEKDEDCEDPNPMLRKGINKDPWAHKAEGMKCLTCMSFCNFRCRKHAPTMSGYPAVYGNDWCGDHKIDKTGMGGE